MNMYIFSRHTNTHTLDFFGAQTKFHLSSLTRREEYKNRKEFMYAHATSLFGDLSRDCVLTCCELFDFSFKFKKYA